MSVRDPFFGVFFGHFCCRSMYFILSLNIEVLFCTLISSTDFPSAGYVRLWQA